MDDSHRLSNEDEYQSHNSADQIDFQQFKKITKSLFSEMQCSSFGWRSPITD